MLAPLIALLSVVIATLVARRSVRRIERAATSLHTPQHAWVASAERLRAQTSELADALADSDPR